MYEKRKKLTCKDAEKMIMPYIEEQLSIEELECFMDHVGKCENCKEELSIQFLVNTGLKSLEKGDNFDLNYELIESLESSRRRVQKKRLLQRIFRGIIAIGIVAAIVLVVFWLIFRV